jgi:hypothetical protein
MADCLLAQLSHSLFLYLLFEHLGLALVDNQQEDYNDYHHVSHHDDLRYLQAQTQVHAHPALSRLCFLPPTSAPGVQDTHHRMLRTAYLPCVSRE